MTIRQFIEVFVNADLTSKTKRPLGISCMPYIEGYTIAVNWF